MVEMFAAGLVWEVCMENVIHFSTVKKKVTIGIHCNWNESKLLFSMKKTINFLQAPFKRTAYRGQVFDISKILGGVSLQI